MNNWKKIPFTKSVLKSKRTKKIPKKSFLDDGAFPIISQGDALIEGYWNNEEDVYRVDRPVIIFGDHTKEIKYVDFDFVRGADGVKVLSPVESLYPKFFFYQLKNLKIRDLGYARHFRLLKKKNILVPPLPEQKRIVAILDEAFAAIDQAKANIERNIENAEELFQSKLNAVFSQRGEGWEKKKLKEVCEIRPSKRQIRNKLSDENLVSFVPMKHLKVNSKSFTEESFRPLKEVYKGYTYFEDGDVLLAKITPCFENGKLGIATNLKNGVGFGSSEYIVYRPGESLSNEFLYYFLNRENFRKIGESLMDGAVGHQRIQKEFYEEFKISYPKLSEQNKIVCELDLVSNKKTELLNLFAKKISALEELKKSLLQKAFAAELTEHERQTV